MRTWHAEEQTQFSNLFWEMSYRQRKAKANVLDFLFVTQSQGPQTNVTIKTLRVNYGFSNVRP